MAFLGSTETHFGHRGLRSPMPMITMLTAQHEFLIYAEIDVDIHATLL